MADDIDEFQIALPGDLDWADWPQDDEDWRKRSLVIRVRDKLKTRLKHK